MTVVSCLPNSVQPNWTVQHWCCGCENLGYCSCIPCEGVGLRTCIYIINL